MRILNLEPEGYSPRARAILDSVGDVVDLELARGELLARLADYDVLIVRFGHRIDRGLIDAGSRLKAIVTAATGVDHIDVEYARSKGIAVLSLRGEYEFLESVSASAEHSWALLLALLRRIPQAFASVRRGDWNRDLFRGHDLCDKRLGIVGLGRVGRKVASYGQAFAMRVAAYDPEPLRWPEGVERCDSLAKLCQGRDVLSVHVPLTDETTRLVGRESLQRLAPGAVLINTSRGEVLDEEALLESLVSGQLAGAAVDVVCGEGDSKLLSESALLAYARSHENLLVTPHIGGATFESMAKTEIFMAEKVARFLQGRSCPKG